MHSFALLALFAVASASQYSSSTFRAESCLKTNGASYIVWSIGGGSNSDYNKADESDWTAYGTMSTGGDEDEIKGCAYSGGRAVSRVEVTLDDGITWTLADIIRAEETMPQAARHELTPHQTQQATTAADATATNTGAAVTATGTNTGAETATGSAVTNTATATSYYGRMMGYAAASQLTYTTVTHTGSSVYEGELTDISRFVSSSDCSSKRLFVTPISDFLQAFQRLQASVDYGFGYTQPGCFSTYLARQRTYASLGCLDGVGNKAFVLYYKDSSCTEEYTTKKGTVINSDPSDISILGGMSVPSLQKCYPCNPNSDGSAFSDATATSSNTQYDGPYDLCTSIISEAVEIQQGSELWDLAHASMKGTSLGAKLKMSVIVSVIAAIFVLSAFSWKLSKVAKDIDDDDEITVNEFVMCENENDDDDYEEEDEGGEESTVGASSTPGRIESMRSKGSGVVLVEGPGKTPYTEMTML
ncbi:hypothetical protein TrLO_g6831 [Triparma laevis f. longispina]|uniref:Moybdenum cofactor oxidoreductase dimerisation domain-containing protein n=1 Tax=Triparma laevis f. longispina TaxID=1714387 RepID=A0A9W7FC27_9STRA|nr:hypothetical protein TrLO_g6831 [Triparma laevis f. longispina]